MIGSARCALEVRVAIRCQSRLGLHLVEAGPLPHAIAFLARYGIPDYALAEAGRIAALCDVPPDEALLRCGLADEEAVYRALAREVGLPFLSGDLRVHPR